MFQKIYNSLHQQWTLWRMFCPSFCLSIPICQTWSKLRLLLCGLLRTDSKTRPGFESWNTWWCISCINIAMFSIRLVGCKNRLINAKVFRSFCKLEQLCLQQVAAKCIPWRSTRDKNTTSAFALPTWRLHTARWVLRFFVEITDALNCAARIEVLLCRANNSQNEGS